MAIVLIVEDEVQVLVLAESILQHAGYETLSASTLAEADAVIHSENKFDLIFTDLGLGNQAEAGLGQSASQARPGIPVLYNQYIEYEGASRDDGAYVLPHHDLLGRDDLADDPQQQRERREHPHGAADRSGQRDQDGFDHQSPSRIAARAARSRPRAALMGIIWGEWNVVGGPPCRPQRSSKATLGIGRGLARAYSAKMDAHIPRKWVASWESRPGVAIGR